LDLEKNTKAISWFNWLMVGKIQSMPAKICLGITALIMFVYSINFMFFADCYSIGGDSCFAILNNKTANAPGEATFWGNGAPETAFNGILMFGIFMSSMIIMIEGPKGKWTTMIPVSIGLTIMAVAVWTVDKELLEINSGPKYVVPLLLGLYLLSYFLMWGEGVNEGLSDYKPGIKVQDKVALSALVILVVTGLIYAVRMIFMTESYIEEGFSGMVIDYETRATGQGPPAEITVIVSGALLLTYALFAALTLTDGAKGKWSILHPSMFAFILVTLGTIVGVIAETARVDGNQNMMNIAAGPIVMLLVLAAYFRLIPEGMEEGMTFQGKPADTSWFVKFLATFSVIMGILFAVTSILWDNVSV